MAKKTAEPEARKVELDIRPAPEAGEGLALRNRSTDIVVVDRSSHTDALEFIRAAKQVKRRIEEHWSRITRSVDEMKRNLLNLKREDLQPIEDAISRVERVALDYENAERKRQREEEERIRIAAEEKAKREREAELERLEREALKREASSKDLSARESVFVDAYIAGLTAGDAFRSAKMAGYKDPLTAGAKLLGTQKIQDAISARRTAAEIRKQAEARKQAPIEVVTEKVESKLGKAAGTSTRTNYSAKVVNLEKFRSAVLNGTIPLDYIEPNMVELNVAAKRLTEKFEQAFPGCELVTKQGIAG